MSTTTDIPTRTDFRVQELEQKLAYIRSATLTLLLDLQVMLESGEYEEALEFLKGHTEDA